MKVKEMLSSAEESLRSQAARSPRLFAVVGWVLTLGAGCLAANLVLSSLGLFVEWVTVTLWLVFRLIGLVLLGTCGYLALRTAIFAGKQIPREDSEATPK